MGSKNHRWNNGASSERKRIWSSLEYKIWSRNIKEFWDFTCQICGRRGIEIHSNHIKKYADYPELRFELNNGIAIC